MNILKIFVSIIVILLLQLNMHALQPKTEYVESISQAFPDLSWKEYDIPSGELVTLKSWKLEPTVDNSNNNILIIFVLPDSTNMSYYIHPAASLAQAGYQVLMFDYRGYGQSTIVGHDEEDLYKEAFKDDLLAVLKFAKSNFHFKKIGYFGFSMGSLIAQLAAYDEKVDFMIYESLIINPVMYASRMKQHFHKSMVLPEDAFDFEKRMKKVKIKSLIFYGRNDVLITRGDMDRYVGQRKNRELFVYDGGHLQGFEKLTKEVYGDQIVFLINNFFK